MSSHEIGAVVRLKSGGPSMTVDSFTHDREVVCQWFAGSKLERGVFPAQSLEPVSDNATKQ